MRLLRILLPVLLALLPACSLKRVAVNKFSNALASGGSTYETDDDPELVASAVPFGLKLMESLIAESPKHKGLLFAATTGFAEYSYAYVDELADETAAESVDRSQYLRARARRLGAHAAELRLRFGTVRYLL